jgi:hypothetical protein
MWNAMFFLIAMVISIFSGAEKDVVWFSISAVLFIISIVFAKFEIKNEPIWLAGASAAFIWLGAMGGLSWPILH